MCHEHFRQKVTQCGTLGRIHGGALYARTVVVVRAWSATRASKLVLGRLTHEERYE